ncbi:MAG: hypothetical protein LBR78_00155 [Holosporales bacterium]|nr:hypothetical protein [Holosporales bacterium]
MSRKVAAVLTAAIIAGWYTEAHATEQRTGLDVPASPPPPPGATPWHAISQECAIACGVHGNPVALDLLSATSEPQIPLCTIPYYAQITDPELAILERLGDLTTLAEDEEERRTQIQRRLETARRCAAVTQKGWAGQGCC